MGIWESIFGDGVETKIPPRGPGAETLMEVWGQSPRS